MKKKPVILLMFALALGASAQNQNIAYYRDVHIDDRQYQFVAKDKIPLEIAIKTNCYRVEFDAQGRFSKIQYSKRGKISIDNYGVSDVNIVYSDSVEQRYYNYLTKNDSTPNVRLQSLILDENKNPVWIKLYDENGNFTKDKYGITQYKRILNADGWMVKCQFFDENQHLTANNNGDYSFGYKWNNNKKFHIPETSYYNQAGELHDGERGYAVARMWFDKKERRNYETRYFNANLQPALKDKRYSVVRRTFYENGLVKTSQYFGTNNKPIDKKAGYCKIENEYNSFGNIAKRKCYYNKNRYYKYMEYTYKYDDNQNLIETVQKLDGKTLVVK
ncbi:MAG: hypothetical protein FWF72_03230 [Paludibacter sp.]|nr:hypothetical protein [Paludibacter sp.]